MSFSSILSQIKHKTKDQENKVSQSYNYNPNGNSKRSGSSGLTASKTQPRPISASSVHRSRSEEPPRTIDPAVQRLKELRRIENAKKEAANPKPRTQRRSNTSPSTTSRQPAVRRRRTPEVQVKESALLQRPRSSSPQKRLSFKELMLQAEEKARLLKERKEESPNPASTPVPKHVSKTQPRSTRPSNTHASSNIRRTTPTPNSRSQQSIPPRQRSAPPPPRPKPKPKEFAKPSAQLQAKLDAKKRKEQSMKKQSYYEDDEYESDFIDYDEEEEEEKQEEDPGYDRDEIWKMFNRGKSRSDYVDYDDDLSDMEATGSEVLNEELRSAKRARLEEKEEAERERRRIEEKKRRLGK